MPPTNDPVKDKTLQDVVLELDRYPIDAFYFLQQGLSFTVEQIHGGETDSTTSRHISGQQLCHGLRDYALTKWGLLARTVLRRWNIHSTLDFGRIVFTLVDNGMMQKTDDDTLEDFRDVFDFRNGFESGYRIGIERAEKATEGRT
jgi:uncharacterized repeat protein (TIGR04138 family)